MEGDDYTMRLESKDRDPLRRIVREAIRIKRGWRVTA